MLAELSRCGVVGTLQLLTLYPADLWQAVQPLHVLLSSFENGENFSEFVTRVTCLGPIVDVVVKHPRITLDSPKN